MQQTDSQTCLISFHFHLNWLLYVTGKFWDITPCQLVDTQLSKVLLPLSSGPKQVGGMNPSKTWATIYQSTWHHILRLKSIPRLEPHPLQRLTSLPGLATGPFPNRTSSTDTPPSRTFFCGVSPPGVLGPFGVSCPFLFFFPDCCGVGTPW